MKIQVTRQDIIHGIRRNSCYSPIALAVKRVTGKDVSVTSSICIDNTFYSYPSEVKSFIDSFDFGTPVEPFEFEININQEID